MNSKLDTTLREVAEDTLASLAFLMPQTEEERMLLGGSGPLNAPRQAARVEFSGPFTGCIVLNIDSCLLQPLAANMLGLPGAGGAPVEIEYDALKELLNVVCGNLLPRIATSQDVFKVHSPEILEQPAAADIMERQSPQSHVSLCVDGGEVDFALFVDQLEPTAAA